MGRTLVPVILLAVACSGDDGEFGECPHGAVTIRNEGGKAHGEPCTDPSECLYGYCYKSPTVTKEQFGFCTKPCDCGEGSSCSDDGPDFTCGRFSSAVEDRPSVCVRACTSVADCPAGYTACTAAVGVTKFCVVE